MGELSRLAELVIQQNTSDGMDSEAWIDAEDIRMETYSEVDIEFIEACKPTAIRWLYGRIAELESQLAEYHKQIPHLLRFVPPQNHDPLCRLHNDAVDYLLESIKGEDS